MILCDRYSPRKKTFQLLKTKKKRQKKQIHLRFRPEDESLLVPRTTEVFIYWHSNDRRAHWLWILCICQMKESTWYPSKEKTHLHVGSKLPSGGRPHAILRSRQKVQARLGRRGSCTLLDALVLALLVALGTGVFTVGARSDGTGSGAGRVFRPIAVNGGPSSLRA